MDVAARKRQAGAGREAGHRAIVTAQDDFCSERVCRETDDGRDLFVGESAQCPSEREMMGCDVNR